MQPTSSSETAKRSLFLSYCRRETPFVNDLFKVLEKEGYPVWLDYQCLIPGKPWQEQIEAGIERAEVFLLVVSREAIASPNVEYEWRRAVELDKRIVLLIFEAVPLPMELQYCEWIDFRDVFWEGFLKLQVRLELSAAQKQNPPQRGFKVSPWVWLTVAIAAVASCFSTLSWWALYIPYYLIPLPYRILRRDFNFYRVQNSLLFLPITTFFQIVMLLPDEWSSVKLWLLYLNVASVVLLLILLRTPAVRRWSKPIASRPQFANPYVPQISNPRPVRYWIDHAPEDAKYARDMHRKLQRYGHLPVAQTDAPEAVIVLISAFKKGTASYSEQFILYPVILQSTDAIDAELQRVQWIDFRSGLRNLDRFAQLLPEPTRLLKALGIAPMSGQIVLPRIVQILVYTLSFLAVVSVGGWLTFVFQLNYAMSLKEAGFTFVLQMLSIVVTIRMIRALLRRHGKFASAGWLYLSLAVLLINALIQAGFVPMSILGASFSGGQVLAMLRLIVIQLVYLLMVIGLALLTLWYRRDLRRWFPSRHC